MGGKSKKLRVDLKNCGLGEGKAATPSGVGLKFWFFQMSRPEAADARLKSTTTSKQRRHHAT